MGKRLEEHFTNIYGKIDLDILRHIYMQIDRQVYNTQMYGIALYKERYGYNMFIRKQAIISYQKNLNLGDIISHLLEWKKC